MRRQLSFFLCAIALCMFIQPLAFGADLTINVNGASFIRTIPMTMYGGNLTAWDGAQSGSNSTFNNLLIASGRKYLRWCGGSWGDAFLWSDMEGPNNANTWIVSYSETLNLLNLISQPGEEVPPTLQPIVNFPGYWYNALQDGTPEDPNDNNYPVAHEAAVAAATAWVQDQSARTPTAQYWEIGNETGGPWEAGWFEGISGTYYGDYFADFSLAMKAVNPTIKIGATVNPSQQQNTYGWYTGIWTYDTLVAADAKGVVPDFLIIHDYPGGGSASDNPTLLADRVDDIAEFTSSLDEIVNDALGLPYVGQIRYWMTEWDCGASDTYNRRQAYVNAMFHAQYTLEMAKHNWEGSNAWAQWEYGSGYFVYPVWYIHPLLINYFGRDMVTASSSHALVRAYASTDADDNLTLFIVNNSPAADLTADIDISGFNAESSAEQWLIEPAGSIISGGVNIQDMDNISINGIVHPNPLTAGALSGQAFTAGNSFSLTLPKSSMVLLKIPGQIQPDTVPPDPDPMTWAIEPYVSGVDSVTMEAVPATDSSGVEYYFSCTSGNGYNSGWQSSPVYEAVNLSAGVTYTYTVKARDLSVNRNETAASSPASVTMIPVLTTNLDLANPSFENGKTGWSFDPDGKFYTDSSQSTDGDWALHAGWYPDGTEVYFYENGIWQDTDYTIQSGDLFVLRFDYWSENGWGAHEVNADLSYYDPDNPADTGLIATTKFQTGGLTYQWITFSLTADANVTPSAIGKKLRVQFRPMGYAWSYYKFDNVRVYQTVYNPQPTMWANTVGLDDDLSWMMAIADWQANGWTFDVYMSSDWSKVIAMDPDVLVASGLTVTTFDPGTMNAGTDYYWRVVANETASVAHPGPVWYFTSEEQWLYGDFTEDNRVDLDDLSGFLNLWLTADCTYDLDSDCRITLYEFSRMAQNWLDN